MPQMGKTATESTKSSSAADPCRNKNVMSIKDTESRMRIQAPQETSTALGTLTRSTLLWNLLNHAEFYYLPQAFP